MNLFDIPIISMEGVWKTSKMQIKGYTMNFTPKRKPFAIPILAFR